MAKTPITPDTAEDFKARINALTPDAQPTFGSMDVVKTLRHMRNFHEAAVGDVSYPTQTNRYVGKLMYYAFCHVVTNWPKGKIKAPEFWTPAPEHEFEEEKEKTLAAIDRFVEEYQTNPTRVVPNPFFGHLTIKQWARLNGLHLDHHLRQFGAN